MRVTVVVPCYNEQDNIESLVKQTVTALSETSHVWDILLIDDGSRDATRDRILALESSVPQLGHLFLSRNFGKEAAILAGLQHAVGDAVILMDADLQHPPQLLPEMLRTFVSGGFDQVVAQRNRTGEAWQRRHLARAFYRVMSRISSVDLVDGAGDFRLLSRRAVDSLLSMREVNRFSKGLYSFIGYRTALIPYENQERESGSSSWKFSDLLDYGLTGALSFNVKPLRVMIYVGAIAVAGFLLYLFLLVANAMIFGIDVPGYVTVVATTVLLAGVQLFSLGVIGEYVGRIYLETKGRPLYFAGDSHLGTTGINPATSEATPPTTTALSNPRTADNSVK